MLSIAIRINGSGFTNAGRQSRISLGLEKLINRTQIAQISQIFHG
jgi:hypothetical protein